MADYDSALPIRTFEVDGDTVAATTPIFLMGGTDGSNYQAVAVDSSGNLQVDVVAPLPTGTNTIGKVQITDTTDDLDILVANSAYGATSTGLGVFGKFEGTPTTYGDGDATPLLTDANGRLQVDIISGGAGASSVDDSAFGIGSDDVAPMGALADDTAPDSVDEGDVGLVRMGLNRILYNQPFDGTNKMPMLDANTRAGYMQITDGTDDLQVVVDGAAEGTNGIHLLGTDGTNAQILSTTSAGVLNVNVGGNVSNSDTYATANLVKDTPTTTATLAGAAVVRKIVASGSGLMKVEVKFGTTASEAVIAVFYNSTADPNIEYEWPGGLTVAGGQTILLSCTNLETAASPTSDFDGHGTIMTEA